MYLVWLRVAAVLYAVASLTALPAVLYSFPRWRKICLPATGLAFLFHLVSATEMLGLAHRWVPVGYGEVESLLGLLIAGIFLAISGIYGTVSFGVFALPASFLLVFVPALGANRYTFPSAGVRVGWLVVHIAFLLAAYASLAFSMVASFLYHQDAQLDAIANSLWPSVAKRFALRANEAHISKARCGAPKFVNCSGWFRVGFFAATGYPGANCACDAFVWISLHDAGFAGWFAAGAGERRASVLFRP